jgi:hypothetical protein
VPYLTPSLTETPGWQAPSDGARARAAVGPDGAIGHAAVLRTLGTDTGQITLIVNDDSEVRADALALQVEAALMVVLRRMEGAAA